MVLRSRHRTHRGRQKSWSDLSNQAQKEIEHLTEGFGAAATQALQKTEAGWSQLAASLAQSAEAARTNAETYKTELNALLTGLSGLRQRLEPLDAGLVNAGEAVTTFQRKTRDSMIDSGNLGQVLQDAKQTLLALNDTTKRVDTDLISQVAEMGKAHGAMVDGCKSLIADVDALCRIALESITDRTQDATTTLGQAAEQADSLKAKYDQRLSDGEFNQHFEPIWEAGKTGKVRSYSCIFWIRVWDKTAPGAKMRWKQAHDKILEGLFGTYQVQDDPWLPTATDS